MMEHRNSPRWVKVRELQARREELRDKIIIRVYQMDWLTRDRWIGSEWPTELADVERQLKELEGESHAKVEL